MDPDVIGIIIALFAFTATVLGGVSRMIARQSRGLEVRFDRIDERFTKVETDIADLRTELRTEMADLKTELKTDIADLRTELKGDMADLRAELKQDISEVKTDLKADIADVRISVARLEGPLPKLQRI